MVVVPFRLFFHFAGLRGEHGSLLDVVNANMQDSVCVDRARPLKHDKSFDTITNRSM